MYNIHIYIYIHLYILEFFVFVWGTRWYKVQCLAGLLSVEDMVSWQFVPVDRHYLWLSWIGWQKSFSWVIGGTEKIADKAWSYLILFAVSVCFQELLSLKGRLRRKPRICFEAWMNISPSAASTTVPWEAAWSYLKWLVDTRFVCSGRSPWATLLA